MFIAALYRNIPKLETAQISINRRMDKQIVVYPYKEILLGNKNTNTWMNLKNVCYNTMRIYNYLNRNFN